MKKCIHIFIFSIWIGVFSGNAQNIQVTVGSLSSCASEIAVPVNVSNLINTAAISLTLNYDANVLTYKGYRSLNNALASGISAVNGKAGTFVFSWTNTNAVSIQSGLMFEMIFETNGASSFLNWLTTTGSCEITDTDGKLLAATYTNGYVSSGGQVAKLTGNLENFAAIEGVNKSFSLPATGVSTVQWQESSDQGVNWANLTDGVKYSGARSTTLTFLSPSLNMSGYLYRCIFSGACPPADTTNQVKLTVLSKATITAHNVNSCANEILIPITVQEFRKIGAFSFILGFDSTKLNYLGIHKVNQAIPSPDLIVHATKNRIYLAWASTSSITLAERDTLLILKMFTFGQHNSLTWNTAGSNCEIADENGNVLQVIYNNSIVSSPGNPPDIYGQTNKLKIYAGKTGNLTVSAGSVSSYRWQYSNNNGLQWSDIVNNTTYSGVNNYSLQLSNVTLSMNNYWYRCICSGPCPPTDTTKNIILTVEPEPQTIITTIPTMNFCSENFSVPVTVKDFNNVSSVSLGINYNSQIVEFKGISKIHPALKSGMVVSNAYNNKINFSWVSVTPATIGTDTLFYIDFHSTGGSASFTWDLLTPGNCEYGDGSANVILSQFVNGTVSIDTTPFNISFTGLGVHYCASDVSVTLTGNPSGGGFSGPGISGSRFDPALAGAGNHIITYTYKNYKGCVFTFAQTVKVSGLYKFTDEINICKGSECSWHGKTYNIAGQYFDNFKSISGCDSIYQLNLTVNQVDVGISTLGSKITANAESAGYQWINCDYPNQLLEGQISRTYSVVANGNYAVIVTQGLCSDTSVCQSVILNEIVKSEQENLTVYPNPVSNELIIEYEGINPDVEFEILNFTGQVIYRAHLNNKTIIDTSRFEKGVYLIRIGDGIAVEGKRFLKI